MIRIYLAHSVHRRSSGKEIASKLETMGYEVYNPFYPKGDNYRGDIEALDKGHIQPWDIPDKDRSEWIIKVDLRGVLNSDILVCIYPDMRTVGIPCEMMFAWMNHIPIYSVVPEDMVGHPWIVGLSQEVFLSIDELYDYLAS